MRLKEDKSNWKASNIIRKTRLWLDEAKHIGRRKNTRKWCRGKVGIAHQFVTTESHKLWNLVWHIERCRGCGKKKHVTDS